LVLLLGILVPRVAGATTYAVLANSMAPRYPMGTLMVVRPRASIATGDVITYQVEPNDPTVVTHRVVGVGATIAGEPRFTTRGDNNEIADPALVQPEQIRGVLWYAVPFAGFLVTAVGGWREYAKLAAAALLVGYAIYQVVRTMMEKRRPARRAPQRAPQPTNSQVAWDYVMVAAPIIEADAPQTARTLEAPRAARHLKINPEVEPAATMEQLIEQAAVAAEPLRPGRHLKSEYALI